MDETGFPWLETVIEVSAIVIGALIVAWQVGKQFEHGRKLQQENAKEKLRLEIFREIKECAKQLAFAESNSTSFARSVLLELELWNNPDFPGVPKSVTDRRPTQFSDLSAKVGDAHVAMLLLLEKYEIVNPELTIFRTAFNVAMEDYSEAHRPLFQKYFSVLPIDIPTNQQGEAGASLTPDTPTDEAIKEIQECTDTFINAASRIGDFVHDLGIETQNILLGGLFDNRVPRRAPIDPSNIVVSTDPEDVKRLTAYFENETTWGRRKKEAEDAARVQHEGRGEND